MGENRITFYGWIDHSVETLEEIIEDLKNVYLFYTVEAIQKLKVFKKKATDSSEHLENAEEIVGYIGYCIKLFQSFEYDFKRLLNEIPQGVENRHIDIVNQIYERSCIDDKSQAREFKKEHLQKDLKDESLRPLLSEIYKVSREIFTGNKNLGSLKERLKTFVGAEGLIEEISIPTKGKSKEPKLIVPLEMPEEARWQDIMIKFYDFNYAEIRVGDKGLGLKKFTTLGFMDKRTKPMRSDSLWDLLFFFGLHNGEILWNDIVNPKKKISRLRKRLLTLFKINDDPFFQYRETKSYKTKFNVSTMEDLIEEESEAGDIQVAHLQDIQKRKLLIGEDKLDWADFLEVKGKYQA